MLTFALLTACGSGTTEKEDDKGSSSAIKANVTEVTAQGATGNYTFYVTIASDETGCDQYADWWEVLSADGNLIHRRILAHSHPADQPFTRSGSPVAINQTDIVYIRAHMNKLGYVGDVFKGSVATGFLKETNLPNFSATLDQEVPLPSGCAF